MNVFRRGAVRIAGLEPVVVALAAPFLLFPTLRPASTLAACAALVVVWLARWAGHGRPGARTPLDVALLLLAVMIPVGVWASAFPDLTIPKLTGLLLGLAVFRATVNAAGSPRRLWTASLIFLALGLGLVAVGTISADWFVKWPALEPILSRIPHLFGGLPGAEEGIHLNELAGTILLVLPVLVSLVWVRGPWRARARVLLQALGLSLAAATAALLFLTQSRSAWIGAGAAAAVMAWLLWPRLHRLMVIGVVVLVLILLYVGPQELFGSVFTASSFEQTNRLTSTQNLEGRMVVYDHALRIIGEFPVTGVGLGAFREAAFVLYPGFSQLHSPQIAHAHNVFFQAALDLGIPGLVAYLALVGTALWIGWRAARPDGGEFRWLGLGIAGSLVAFHAYGLTDAVALGAKPGVALWMLLGLSAALWAVAGQGAGQTAETP